MFWQFQSRPIFPHQFWVGKERGAKPSHCNVRSSSYWVWSEAIAKPLTTSQNFLLALLTLLLPCYTKVSRTLFTPFSSKKDLLLEAEHHLHYYIWKNTQEWRTQLICIPILYMQEFAFNQRNENHWACIHFLRLIISLLSWWFLGEV